MTKQAANNRLYAEILSRQDPSQVEGLSRFFKTGKGQYGEGDRFLGIKVPVIREVVKDCWKTTSFEELETCIASEYHEMRMAALLTLVQLFKHAKNNKPTASPHCGQGPAISCAHVHLSGPYYRLCGALPAGVCLHFRLRGRRRRRCGFRLLCRR